jgi:phosphoglycerate dehydrogenase-like enzyme
VARQTGDDVVTKIAVLDDYQGASDQFGNWASLADCSVQAFHDHIAGQDLVDRLVGVDVVVAMRERTVLDRATIERLPRLKLIVTTGMSNAAIDLAAAADRGVLVCGTGGIVANTVELTWGLILSLLRHIPAEDANVRAGGWQHTMGGDLQGRTLGLLGLGRTGAAMARVAAAFDMRVIAWSQNLTAEAAAERGATYVSKEELFSTADVLSVHLTLSDRSRALVGASELALMAPTAVLINTSRGPIVDEAALVEALRTRRLGGAALDVYDVEPLPLDHPLRRLPNVVLTPHLGYVTERCYRIFYDEIVEDIAAWLTGAPVRVLT